MNGTDYAFGQALFTILAVVIAAVGVWEYFAPRAHRWLQRRQRNRVLGVRVPPPDPATRRRPRPVWPQEWRA
jgi:hypothetical protein